MSDVPAKTGIFNQITKALSPVKSVLKKVSTVKRFASYAEAFASAEAKVLPSDYLCKVLSAALNVLDSAEDVIQNNSSTLNEYTMLLDQNQANTLLKSLLINVQHEYKVASENKMASCSSNSSMSLESNAKSETRMEMWWNKKLQSKRNN